MTFEKDYRAGFDWLTDLLNTVDRLKDYEFTEIVLPNGEIQRWWRGHGESIIISYKSPVAK